MYFVDLQKLKATDLHGFTLITEVEVETVFGLKI